MIPQPTGCVWAQGLGCRARAGEVGEGTGTYSRKACLCGSIKGSRTGAWPRGKLCNSVRGRVSFPQQSCWPAWAGAPAGPATGSGASGRPRFPLLSNGVIVLSTSQGCVRSHGFAEPVVKPDANASQLHVKWAPVTPSWHTPPPPIPPTPTMVPRWLR